MKILGNIGITKLIDLIASKFAPKDSPELTGTPTAPTPESGDNSTQVATTEFVNSKAGEYLPLSGGIMKGSIYATPRYDSTLPYGGKVAFGTKGKVAKGTLPAENECHTLFVATDNTGNVDSNKYKYGQFETDVCTDGSTSTIIQVFKNEADSTVNNQLTLGYDAAGNPYTFANTPAKTSNDNNIATTAFVKTNLADYLPLAGGTLNGGLTWLGGTNGTDLCGFKFGGGTAANNYYAANFNSMDFGWNWDTGAGSGMAFRNATYGGTGSAQAGAFIFFARNNTTAAMQLEGHVDGTLLWQGNVFRLGSHVNITYNASTSSLDFSFV